MRRAARYSSSSSSHAAGLATTACAIRARMYIRPLARDGIAHIPSFEPPAVAGEAMNLRLGSWDLGKDLMERHFEKDLNEMKERLLWRAASRSGAVHQAVHAVPRIRRTARKRRPGSKKTPSTSFRWEIDDRVVQLLALHTIDGHRLCVRCWLALASITISSASAIRPSISPGRVAHSSPPARQTLR